MSEKIEILFPTGRLVGGSLYDGKTKDADGNQLKYKTGKNAGEDRTDFYFGLAIAKKTETHWNQTEWGKQIYELATKEFGIISQNPQFAWKIVDGDSPIPNKAGNAPCDRQGFRGHWVLNFSGASQPKVVNEKGKEITQENFVNLGDFVRVLGSINDNKPSATPGIYLNHVYVAFRAYGERISYGTDPTSVNFADDDLPAGANVLPVDTSVPVSAAPVNLAPPHHEILNLVPRKMTAKALAPYEVLISQGWTDALLIQHGMMEA